MSDNNIIEKLKEFWLLDVNEYSVINELIQNDIDRLDKEIHEFISSIVTGEDETRMNNESIQLRDFLIVLKEKIQYMIMNGLYKKHRID